ncbi:MAG TPA: hypothetical protein VMT35_15305, partial [Ignavibacteriaceae bacterium]|nr:hypothetical protein [Ignavibacteriaceae bacterium]
KFSLPSTGHLESTEPGSRTSNGILSVQLWIEDEKVNPQFISDENEQYYTVETQFEPNEIREVNALFWAETSLSDVDSLTGLDTVNIAGGKRGFLIDLEHAAAWNGTIQSVEVYLVLMDGILPGDPEFSAYPPDYELHDNTLSWSMEDIEPSEDDNIEVLYDSGGNLNNDTGTMKKLSSFIVKKAYDQLLDYVNSLEE